MGPAGMSRRFSTDSWCFRANGNNISVPGLSIFAGAKAAMHSNASLRPTKFQII